MNRICLCRFLLVFICCGSLAVAAVAQDFYAGIITGINYADIDMVTMRIDHQTKAKTELGIGGIFGYHFNENISVQLEPLYVQKGGISKIIEETDVEMNIRFSSIELPILLKVEFGERIRPYLLAGPSFAIVTGSVAEIKTGALNLEVDMADIINTVEAGLIWGGGVSYMLGKISIYMETVYAVGLTNLNNGGKISYTFAGESLFELQMDKNDKIKNSGLRVMAGIIFPISG